MSHRNLEPIRAECSAETSVFIDIFARFRNSDEPALLGEKVVTYRMLFERVLEICSVLSSNGVAPGSLVAVGLPHSLDSCASLFALPLLGAVPVLVDPLATDVEKGTIIRDAGAGFAISSSSGIGSQTGVRSRFLIDMGESTLSVVDGESISATPNVALIIYTSGTTGTPKGVVLTHGSLGRNVRAVCGYLQLSDQDKGIVFTPPALAFAVSQLLTHLLVGAPILQWPHGLMFPGRLLNAIRGHAITGVSCNPTSIRIIARSATPSTHPCLSVRYVMLGGQALSPADVELARQVFPRARVVNMYGCTENSPRIAYHWIDSDVPLGTPTYPVGIPVAGTRIRIGPGDSVSDVHDRVGEIYISGSSLSEGYWRMPDLTRERFVEGWFATRDYGFVDSSGNLHIVGRLDTILNVGHQKVSPEEVEGVIADTPGVRDVGVTGQADKLLGVVPVALIVADGSFSDVVKQVQSRCCERLSRHKIPTRFEKVESIPRNSHGKVDRVRLRETARSLLVGVS